MTPTDRQVRLLRSARAWAAEYGEPPSMRELAAAAGISVSTVSYQLKRMWEQGVAIETRGRPSRRCPHCGR